MFYTNPLDINFPGTTTKFTGERFYDSSLHSFTSDGSFGFDTRGNNADLQERIGTISVSGSAGSYTYNCPHGECWVVICKTPPSSTLASPVACP